ncbi:MAG: DNA-directed RNA polymerase subunit beta [Ruminococcaceae bacterium]|nr:DNA-directed RNA polymerase subunit beta [Oscillospiraceae bacterium]
MAVELNERELKSAGLKKKQLGRNIRMSFSKIDEAIDMPNLIEVQKNSYEWFLKEGLMEVFRDVSPIVDYSGTLYIDFVDFTIDNNPKYPVEECKERDVNYACPLKVNVRLTNKATGEIKESVVYMGDFPVMTDNGTFVINGAERVIVSQIVRSPGIYYNIEVDKMDKKLYSATVIPYRGAWLEYETDVNDIFYVRIDKNRKLPVTVLVRALAREYSETADVLELFGNDSVIKNTLAKDLIDETVSRFKSEGKNTSAYDEALKEIYRKLRPGDPPLVESAESLLQALFFDAKKYDISTVGRYKFNKKLAVSRRVAGRVLSRPVVSPFTGEVIFDAGEKLDRAKGELMEYAGITEVWVEGEKDGEEIKIFSNNMVHLDKILPAVAKRLEITEMVNRDVLLEIMEEAEGEDAICEAITRRRDELIPKHITRIDILSSINYLVCLFHDIGTKDDIDHLGNRRLRSVGELLQNQMRIGFMRMDKIVKERMTIQDMESVTPQALINIRPVVSAIKDFFGSSPLSQFMDQGNPLGELTHKRRLSALGPGGLSRDRASFDVRDVHYTQYGRMCPIETPEGPNIGLISYLSTFARISHFGFIEAPYRRVDKETGIVTKEVRYLTADEEDEFIVAQANEPLDENGRFINKKVTARQREEIVVVDAEDIDYMDVSPKMVVSVATAFIPFLENDDNSRALMGSNMQKQAVPLMVNDSPIVGTGMEYKAAVDSGVTVLAKKAGIVDKVSADEIIIKNDEGIKDVYKLIKFKRTNQGTCNNQRPIVSKGERIEAGEVIADGLATQNGEVSLGKNALIGFVTWEGYNYEDAVLINERLVRDDVYTSIHIEEYSHEARDTKLGPEEITREIPSVGPEALKDLDADGIIRIGAEVHSGDILVGKVTPKGETELTAEERLLRAIFGEKAREVRDTSLKLPHGESGIIIDVKVYTRANQDELAPGVNKVVKVYVAQKRKISVGDKMAGRHGNKGVVSRILPPEDMPFLPDGTPLDIVLNPLGVPSRMNIGQVLEVHLGIAARKLGFKIMTPVFDGAKEENIAELQRLAGLDRDVIPGENVDGKNVYEAMEENGQKILRRLTPEERQDEEYLKALSANGKYKVIDGKTVLYDGRTGMPFDNPVTVGIMYFLKLHHLVDDKIHARSTGPYSLVTQQPLGGKAQFGGQRFGEMEVWALEAYGAAYTLQEILTVKSDDIVGRVNAFEAIVKGQNIPTPGIPESFKVLVKELQSLGLNIQALDHNGDEIELHENIEEESAKIRAAEDNLDTALIGETVNDMEDPLMDDEYQDVYDVSDDSEDDFEDEMYSEEEDL